MDEENKTITEEEMALNNDNVVLADVNEEAIKVEAQEGQTESDRVLMYNFSEYEFELICKITRMTINMAKISEVKDWKDAIYKVWSSIRLGRLLYPCSEILDEDIEDLHEIMNNDPDKRKLVVNITYLWADSFEDIMHGFIPDADDTVLMDYIVKYFENREEIDNPVIDKEVTEEINKILEENDSDDSDTESEEDKTSETEEDKPE